MTLPLSCWRSSWWESASRVESPAIDANAHLVVTVLVENGPSHQEGLACEHGLSLHLAYGSLRILLDFGQSDAFMRNADALGIDLAQVDLAVLSHAHYDHANGMDAFFARNTHAPLCLSAACAETCWSTKGGTAEAHYIGMRAGLLAEFSKRLSPVPTDRVTTIAPGVHAVPHTTPNLANAGAKAGMFLREGDAWRPDDFAHELTLVIELGNAADAPLAIFNSCSHAGLPAIVAEVQEAFPNRTIATYVGGLHLVHASDEDILQVARAAEHAGIGQLCTGHCTGEHAVALLQRELPSHVVALSPGLTLAF